VTVYKENRLTAYEFRKLAKKVVGSITDYEKYVSKFNEIRKQLMTSRASSLL
jgi:hypothetical protein